MERFLLRRLPGGEEAGGDGPGLSLPTPPVRRGAADPAGPARAALHGRPRLRAGALGAGGWERAAAGLVAAAASRPSRCCIPEKYRGRRGAARDAASATPRRGRAVVNEGVLGEMFCQHAARRGAGGRRRRGLGRRPSTASGTSGQHAPGVAVRAGTTPSDAARVLGDALSGSLSAPRATARLPGASRRSVGGAATGALRWPSGRRTPARVLRRRWRCSTAPVGASRASS